jgi:cytochrome P450
MVPQVAPGCFDGATGDLGGLVPVAPENTDVRLIDPAVVGEVLALLTAPAGQADPYPHYARLHALGPAGVAPDGTMVVAGYRACSAVLRHHGLVKTPERALAAAGHPDWLDRPSLRLLYGSLLMLNPPAHTRLRGLVSGSFTARRVSGLRPAIERITTDLLDTLDGTFDAVAAFAFPLPVTVIGELLGIPAGDRPMFQSLVRDWTMVLEFLNPLAVDTADAAAVRIRDYLGDLAAERRAHPTGDLLSAFAAARDDAFPTGFAGEELVTMAALLLAAGFETTSGLLSNGLVALLDNPAEAARLRSSDELAASAAQELLRFDSPVQMLFGRSSPTADRIEGVPVEAGQRLITLLGAANRDPGVFAGADQLRLDRAGEPPLSFGGGIHYCLGAPLARLEAEIAFPALLRRFPRLQLAGSPVRRNGLALHGLVELPVTTS